ncbi:Imm50 family immunity protein [Streptomyces sp. NPDC096040]|uniref:Imm50 family immunity protein n=1 Tax=Streptomyces sp. NPDC096040 TaxID=3155541 RepID=UPI00332A8F9B
MNADWTRTLAASDYLGELYDGVPPSPDMCELCYVHIDERGNSATLGFVTRNLPVHPPAEWENNGFNAFEFYLVFTGVDDLRVTGWGASEARQVDLSVRDGGFFEVVLGTEESGITFRAPMARLARTRAYLASDSP